MKKFLSIVLCALLAVSCIIDIGDYAGRTESEIISKSIITLRTSLEGPLEGFYQAMRLQEFIDTDEQGRRDGRFSDIAYYYSDGSYEIGDFGRIVPDGKSLSSQGAVWTFVCDAGIYSLQTTGENSWKIVSDKVDGYWNMASNFTLDIRLDGETLSPNSKFNGTLEGSSTDGSEYHIDFSSTDSFDFCWNITSKQGDTSHELIIEGQIRLEFLKDKELLDWCITDYNRRTGPEYRTSLTQ